MQRQHIKTLTRKVLATYLDDPKRKQAGPAKESVIRSLDIGRNELRNKIRRIGTLKSFCKQLSLEEDDSRFEQLDMGQVIDSVEELHHGSGQSYATLLWDCPVDTAGAFTTFVPHYHIVIQLYNI